MYTFFQQNDCESGRCQHSYVNGCCSRIRLVFSSVVFLVHFLAIHRWNLRTILLETPLRSRNLYQHLLVLSGFQSNVLQAQLPLWMEQSPPLRPSLLLHWDDAYLHLKNGWTLFLAKSPIYLENLTNLFIRK